MTQTGATAPQPSQVTYQALDITISTVLCGLGDSHRSRQSQAGHETADRERRLLRHDAVAEKMQLLVAGQALDIGDVAGGEAHHEFDEAGVEEPHLSERPAHAYRTPVQAGLASLDHRHVTIGEDSRGGRYATEDSFPASNSDAVLDPVLDADGS